MKETTHPVGFWLEHLSQLIPPTGVVVVGAGSGTSRWLRSLRDQGVDDVVLIEADNKNIEHLRRSIPGGRNWTICNEVAAKESGFLKYYLTTPKSESSIINPEELRDFWPNIRTEKTQTIRAVSLNRIVKDTQIAANWWIIDCLPTYPIIEGSAPLLEKLDVVVARVILDGEEKKLGDAGLQRLQTYMDGQGFRLLSIEQSRHPHLGHALFVHSNSMATRSEIQRMMNVEAGRRELDNQTIKDLKERLKNAELASAVNKIDFEKQAAEIDLKKTELEKQKVDLEALSEKRKFELEELAHKLTQMRDANEVLVQVEGQIELIKDLLFGQNIDNSSR